MKKLFAILLSAMLLFTACAALAENQAGEEVPAEAEGMLSGGWAAAADPAITDEVKAVFDKGMEGLVGVDYVPVALLGTQVVAGTNYAFLCQGTVVVPDAVPAWKIVFLYQDLEGSVSILNIADFDFGTLCTYGAEAAE